jgi:hypothetical protein
MTTQRKWSQEMRRFLYQTLTEQFGPYRAWQGHSLPVGAGARFQEVLALLRQALSAQSGHALGPRAVELQLRWALTTQPAITDRYVSAFLLNVAAALEVGFLSVDDLPTCLLQDGRRAGK